MDELQKQISLKSNPYPLLEIHKAQWHTSLLRSPAVSKPVQLLFNPVFLQTFSSPKHFYQSTPNE